MQILRSLGAAISGLIGGMVVVASPGCSSDDRPPLAKSSRGVGCAKGTGSCDIHDAECRQAVLDVVACMRGYDESVRQPTTHFLQLEDLLDDSEPVAGQVQADTDTRRGLSLLGLVSPREVEADDALNAQIDNIAAIYSNTDGTVYVIENPGGQSPSDSDVGGSADAYLMSILAHEYVHFLQDREFDLTKYAESLSPRLDPMLARISAVEGEAMLFEGYFTYLMRGVAKPESEVLDNLTAFVDFAEAELREVASPVLEARMLFPYTYGAYSAALLHQADESSDFDALRTAKSTLPYIERRWGTVADYDLVQPKGLSSFDEHGFEVVAEDNLGPWLVNALFGRELEFSVNGALVVARKWRGDRITVWRDTSSGEIAAQWAIVFDETDAQVEDWARFLTVTPSPVGTRWDIRAYGNELVLTSSTEADSVVYDSLEPSSGSSVGSDADAGNDSDAGAREVEGSSTAMGSASSFGEPDAGLQDLRQAYQVSRAETDRGASEAAMGCSPESLIRLRRVRSVQRLRHLIEQRSGLR